MNSLELHLLTNHIPLFAAFFGFGLGFWALIVNNKSMMVAAMAILVLGGLSAIVANNSGEEAEELVERLAGYDGKLIHEHEEAAEVALLTSIIVAILAIFAWFTILRKWANAWVCVLIASVGGVASFAFMANTAREGGHIVHKELTVLPEKPILKSSEDLIDD
jgi:hypothetical protein